MQAIEARSIGASGLRVGGREIEDTFRRDPVCSAAEFEENRIGRSGRKRRQVDAGRHGRSNAPGINGGRRRTLTRLVLCSPSGQWQGVLFPACRCAESLQHNFSQSPNRPTTSSGIYKLIFWLALIVFVGVQIGIVYTVLHYRRRADDQAAAEQIHGHKTLEDHLDDHSGDHFAGDLHSHRPHHLCPRRADQEPRYGGGGLWQAMVVGNSLSRGRRRGRSRHRQRDRVPQGKRVVFHLFTNNVIHSFWVPQLTGKMDLMPGHINKLAIDTDNPGYFFGQCAEFCGDSHALMRFKVIVEPEEQFLPGRKPGEQVRPRPRVIWPVVIWLPTGDDGLCMTCHEINGAECLDRGGNPVPAFTERELDAGENLDQISRSWVAERRLPQER